MTRERWKGKAWKGKERGVHERTNLWQPQEMLACMSVPLLVKLLVSAFVLQGYSIFGHISQQ